MEFEIRTPAETSADFKRSLHRFLDSRSFANDEGFTMHWAEPQGAEVVQHVSFESAEVAAAFHTTWRDDGLERE